MNITVAKFLLENNVYKDCGMVRIPTVYYDQIMDALKEQEAVVHCKDCKYAPGNKEGYTCKIRDHFGLYMKNPDCFFCADGKRKEGR